MFSKVLISKSVGNVHAKKCTQISKTWPEC